jgi:hypothetical protein
MWNAAKALKSPVPICATGRVCSTAIRLGGSRKNDEYLRIETVRKVPKNTEMLFMISITILLEPLRSA